MIVNNGIVSTAGDKRQNQLLLTFVVFVEPGQTSYLDHICYCCISGRQHTSVLVSFLFCVLLLSLFFLWVFLLFCVCLLLFLKETHAFFAHLKHVASCT